MAGSNPNKKLNFPFLIRSNHLEQTKCVFLEQLNFLQKIDSKEVIKKNQFEVIEKLLPKLLRIQPLEIVIPSCSSLVLNYIQIVQFTIYYLFLCRNIMEESYGSVSNLGQSSHRTESVSSKCTSYIQSPKSIYPCPKCTKNFINHEMLNMHMERKHNEYKMEKSETDKVLINTIKLELEIKQLKERLIDAEKKLESHASNNNSKSTPIEKLLERTAITTSEKGSQTEGVHSTQQQKHIDNEIVSLNARLGNIEKQFQVYREELERNDKSNADNINDVKIDLNDLKNEFTVANRKSPLDDKLFEVINDLKGELFKREEIYETKWNNRLDHIINVIRLYQDQVNEKVAQINKITVNQSCNTSYQEEEKTNDIINDSKQKTLDNSVLNEANMSDIPKCTKTLAQLAKIERYEEILEETQLASQYSEISSQASQSDLSLDTESQQDVRSKSPESFKPSSITGHNAIHKDDHVILKTILKRRNDEFHNDLQKMMITKQPPTATLKQRRIAFKKKLKSFFATKNKLTKEINNLVDGTTTSNPLVSPTRCKPETANEDNQRNKLPTKTVMFRFSEPPLHQSTPIKSIPFPFPSTEETHSNVSSGSEEDYSSIRSVIQTVL